MMMTMPQNKQHTQRTNERGNAFFLVMIGVVLFAGLIFTLSRSARQGGENVSQKQAEIAASAILDYAQKVERGVNNVMNTVSFSEEDISFENDFLSADNNPNCSSARCMVFSPAGGSISYIAPSDDMAAANNWHFSGENTVLGVGANANADLMLMLNDVRRIVCEDINDRLGIATMPTDGDGIEISTLFTGSYNNSEQISGASLDGVSSACVQNTQPDPDEYIFYHVLRAR